MSAPTGVRVTVSASRLAGLEEEAFIAAKSAFEAYGSGRDWKAADGTPLEAHPQGLAWPSEVVSYSGQQQWKADFIVCKKEPF